MGFVPKTHLATEFGCLVSDVIPNGTVLDDNVDYSKGELPIVGQLCIPLADDECAHLRHNFFCTLVVFSPKML